jgi:glycosyltransferase involved in cell wall biosynthesis
MRIVSFVNSLGFGGTEKAACRWAEGLKARGHEVAVLTLQDGPRRAELNAAGIESVVVEPAAKPIAVELSRIQPDVIHAHAPGQPHPGDVLGEALATLPKIPLVQTNIFGRLQNPPEDSWTDFRLFISWTSCVQAARRSGRRLSQDFFRRAGVAVYPLDPQGPSSEAAIAAFRQQCGVTDDEILFGRLSRPEPNKWTGLILDAFQRALKSNPKLKLLLREPPPQVAHTLRASGDRGRYIMLPASTAAEELRLTLSALDVVLHTSSIGESFGYGLAEPMNLGKPAITNSVPWYDQAQIELVQPGVCGFVASTPGAMAGAILRLAGDRGLRLQMGKNAQHRVRTLADAATSIGRLERALEAAVEGRDNPEAGADLQRAEAAAAYLDLHQFGHTVAERITLRAGQWRFRLHEFRRTFLRAPTR